MTTRDDYQPGPANLARVVKEGEQWTLVVVRPLRHPLDKVWQALTDPAQLQAWAPFDADGNLGEGGATVKLSTVGTPMAEQTTIKRAEAPHLLEYSWGDGNLRWELEAANGGTRLTLRHSTGQRFMAMGAAGWQICLDVLDHALAGTPIGRMVGPQTMQFDGWQRLNADYARQFGSGGTGTGAP
jgi:uncharacterized protein YndB with AHSA1/START domain